MNNLRLMVREFYTDGSPPSAHGYEVQALESLKSNLISCLRRGSKSGLYSAEIWLIEADDENGNALDQVCLESWEKER